MTNHSYKQGDRVRITINAGLVLSTSSGRFAGHCDKGTEGEYLGTHPSMSMKAWHLVAVRVGTSGVVLDAVDLAPAPTELMAPLHSSMFEPWEKGEGAAADA